MLGGSFRQWHGRSALPPRSDGQWMGPSSLSDRDETVDPTVLEVGLTESLDLVLRLVLPQESAHLPDDPFMSGPRWFSELAMQIGLSTGLPASDCVPVSVAFELAAAAMLADDERRPMGRASHAGTPDEAARVARFRPAPWRTALLRQFLQAMSGRASPQACAAARFANDIWLSNRCVALVQACLDSSVASIPAFRFNQAIAAGAALGANLALGILGAGRQRPQCDDDEFVVFAESAAAQAVTVILYEVVRSRLSASHIAPMQKARITAAYMEQARRERAYRAAIVHRAAGRVGADMAQRDWLAMRWEPRLQHAWRVMEIDFAAIRSDAI